MALTGDLVTLRVDGVRYLEKAPLPYWLVALSFRLFGFNTFAAHLPQAIGVLLLALLGYRWAAQAFSARAAFYAGLATLTSAGIFLFTRYFIPEVLLSLFLSTALYCLLRALEDPVTATPGAPFMQSQRMSGHSREDANRSPSPNPKPVISTGGGALAAETEKSAFPLSPAAHAYIMWTALALAVLTKGLVALVFFFGAATIYLALTGEYKKWRQFKPLTGALLFLAIAAPWHILAGLRNTGGMNGHGFFWFYFVNEHFLRFLGKRFPKDYNKLPSYLYWTLHLVWLFPWSLFCGVLLRQAAESFSRFNQNNPIANHISYWQPFAVVAVGIFLRDTMHVPYLFTVFVALLAFLVYELRQRQLNSPNGTPLLLISTFTQRTTLLLALFATLVLVFFSLSTNQEYYTFPAYLPLLILIAAALTRAENSYSEDPASRRWITAAHATFTILGLAIAFTLAYGLWTSRHIAFVPDIGDLLAHRNVSNYTLSMSSLFDLTGPSFAALRLPSTLAALAFLIGPATAWLSALEKTTSRSHNNHRAHFSHLPHRRPHRLRPLRANALLKELRRNHPATRSLSLHLAAGPSPPLRRPGLRFLHPLLPRPRSLSRRRSLYLHALRQHLPRRPTHLPHPAGSPQHLGQGRPQDPLRPHRKTRRSRPSPRQQQSPSQRKLRQSPLHRPPLGQPRQPRQSRQSHRTVHAPDKALTRTDTSAPDIAAFIAMSGHRAKHDHLR